MAFSVLRNNLIDVDVLYFLDAKARELETACLVKRLLQERYGYSVVLQYMHAEGYRSLFQYRPKVVVTPFCYSGRSFPCSAFRQVYGDDLVYVNLCWEQILTGFFTPAKTPRDSFVREKVVHCAWNGGFRDWLIRHGVKAEQVEVTGSPQQRLYMQNYSYLHLGRHELARQMGLDAAAPWAVLPMNYAGAFFHPKAIAERLKNGFQPDLMPQYLEFCRRSLDMVLDWTLEAARQTPDKIYIIRPRPTPLETEEGYLELLRGKSGRLPDNLRVIKKLAAREWILSAESVFSSTSTTLLDAAFANIPAYSLAPLPIPEWLAADWMELTPQVATLEEFLEAAKNPIRPECLPELRAYTHRAFGVDAGDPIENIAALIDRQARATRARRSGNGRRSVHRASPRLLSTFGLRLIKEEATDFWGKLPVTRGGVSRSSGGDIQREAEQLMSKWPAGFSATSSNNGQASLGWRRAD